ncbi:MAG: ATP synthase F1 subunit delta [Kosmotogaceae bacterium]|nr:ATP synthase F1 subunit delta [Kosmotogaceae bacterium]
MKRILSLASKYSNALFESLASENHEKALSQLHELSQSISNEELSKFLFDPTIQAGRKTGMLLSFVERPLEQIERLAALLVSMKRLELLPDIETSFAARLLFESKMIDVEVDSALELTSEDKEAILEKVREKTGMQGLLKVTVDPSMIAGYVIRFSDEVIDTSLSGRLKRVSQELRSGPREVIE